MQYNECSVNQISEVSFARAGFVKKAMFYLEAEFCAALKRGMTVAPICWALLASNYKVVFQTRWQEYIASLAKTIYD